MGAPGGADRSAQTRTDSGPTVEVAGTDDRIVAFAFLLLYLVLRALPGWVWALAALWAAWALV